MHFKRNDTNICVGKPAQFMNSFSFFLHENAALFGRIKECDKILVKINIPYWKTPRGSATKKDSLLTLIKFLGQYKAPTFIVESRYNSTATTVAKKYSILPERVIDLFERPASNYPAETIDDRKLNLHVSSEARDKRNFIITIGPPKTHEFVIYTGAVKTMMGFLKDKKRHMHGSNNLSVFSDKETWHKMLMCLHYNLRTLYMLTSTDIAILDGTMCMEGNGPVFGKPVEWDMWAISNNRHSIDYVVSSLMGMNPGGIAYLSLIKDAEYGLNHFTRDLMQEGLFRKFALPDKIDSLLHTSEYVLSKERSWHKTHA